MFRSKTTFIVGAGASAEADMPLGKDLTDQIAGLLPTSVENFGRDIDGDHLIYHAMSEVVKSDDSWRNNQLFATAREIASAMAIAPSIDNFMHTHKNDREVVLLGKLGIARAIQLSERASLLSPSSDHGPFDLRDLDGSWYASLARLLFTDVPAEEPARAFENVDFIVFNYDRCLQAYLVEAIRHYFRVNQATAEQVVDNVTFVHPYGSLGSIFRQAGQAQVPYADPNFDLRSAADRIKTFTESVEESFTIRQMVYDAETLVFLGSAFHPQNLKILDPEAEIFYEHGFNKRIFGTSFGLSSSDQKVVQNQLSSIITGQSYSKELGDWIFLNNGKCSELFSTYWRSLTA